MREVVGRVGFRWALAAVTAVVLAGCSSGLSGLLGTTLQTAEPTFSLEPGEYPRDIQVELASETEGAVIYYTTDGSEPAVSWELYGGPIEVAGHGTQIDVRAYADAEGRQPSGEVLGEFSIAYPLVTLESAGNGTAAFVDGGGTGPRAVEAGTSVEITATAASGFQFGGWTVTNGDPQTVAIADPTTPTTSVTLHGGDATVTGSFVNPDGPTAPQVAVPTLTNDPRPTWSWSSSGGGNLTFRYKLNDADFASDAIVTTATSFTPDSGLNDGDHTLYVQEQDYGGTWSPAGSATVTVDTVAPGPPAIEGVSDGFGSDSVSFTLAWAEPDGTREYRLTSGGTWQSYTGEVTISTEGDYQITARQTDAAGNTSELASTVSGTLYDVPAAPSNLTAIAQNASRIDLSWQDNSDNEDGFEVHRKTEPAGNYAVVASLPPGTTGYEDSGRSPGTVYSYQVRATNGAVASDWSNEAGATTPASGAGSAQSFSADGITWNMRFVPAKSFTTGTDDSGSATVASDFWLAETEVTYELWYAVRDWAENGTGGAPGEGAYSFGNPGREGHDGTDGAAPTADNQEPATGMNWRDAMAWTNALTEWYNAKAGASLEPVYYSDSGYTSPIRTVTDRTGTYDDPGEEDNPHVKSDADGFRLPSTDEWELAARYIKDDNGDGAITTPGEYYPGNYASGADAKYDLGASVDYDDDGDQDTTGDVAWYEDNAGGGTHDVATKDDNALGLFDMSGNVQEWTFDLVSGFERVSRGGDWFDFAGLDDASRLQVGYVNSFGPYINGTALGFRPARNAE